MHLVIFGLTISSSWGNGHATLWRGLCRSLVRRGHRITFFERDVSYYAAHRDLIALEGVQIVLYADWSSVRNSAMDTMRAADAVMVTSYCPDAIPAGRLAAEYAALSVFYDMDTPATLDHERSGHRIAYIGSEGLRHYDLVLSFTGGCALDELRDLLGARRVQVLYGSVDPDSHRPTPPAPQYAAALSYLGTYAADRQDALERLFVDAARLRPDLRFVIGGAQYPAEFPWTNNIFFVRHLPPAEHPSFFCSSPATLNVTRAPFASRGYCPSGRLFEAAACGTAIISDRWEGIDEFFTPGSEILLASDTADVLAALAEGPDMLRRIGRRARERVLDQHTADHRAAELEVILEAAADECQPATHIELWPESGESSSSTFRGQ